MTVEFDDGTQVVIGHGMYPNVYSTDPEYYGNPRAWVMTTLHSTDDGETWEKNLFHIVFPFVLEICYLETGATLLPDGTLMQVCMGREEGDENKASMVIASEDQGRTWEYRGTSGPPKSYRDRLGFGETGIVYHPPSKRMVTLYRPGPVQGPLYGARSDDLGYTWCDPEIIWDEWFDYVTPSMLCLEDGTLIATYGSRRENLAGRGPMPSSAWVMHSEDGGLTWEEPVCVWHGPSCVNNRMWFDGGQCFRVFYSESGFCHFEPRRKDNAVCSVEAEVK